MVHTNPPKRGTQKSWFVSFDVPEVIQIFHDAVQVELARTPGGRPWMRKFPPHITIRSRFNVSEKREGQLWDALLDLVTTEKVRKFQIRLGRIGMFPENGAIYLAVDGDEIMSHMAHVTGSLEGVVRVDRRRRRNDNDIPHITIAKSAQRNHEHILSMIDGLNGRPNGSFTIERLHVSVRQVDDNGEWNMERILALR